MGRSSRRRGRAGAARRALVVLSAFLLAWVAGAPPAAASWSEGRWINSGENARTPSSPSYTTDGTTQWRLVRGDDNGLWISRNNGPASRMNINSGPAGATYVAPAIIATQGRLYAFHTGTDRQVYYSFSVRGNDSGWWTDWRALPGFADTNMAPTVSVLDTLGSNVGVFITRTNGHVAGVRMDVSLDSYPRFPTAWGEVAYGVFRSRPDVTSRFNPVNGRTEIVAVATGSDGHVWSVFSDGTLGGGIGYAPIFFGDLAETIRTSHGPQRLPGAAAAGECTFAPSIARGGRDDRLSNDTSSADFRNQQGLAIGCISSNDGNLWVTRSSDGGRNVTGWSSTSDGAGPSNTTPELHGQGDAVYAALSWDGGQDRRFPDHAIIEKRL
ncbi:hypothetical protein ACIQM4_03520 [Streptomyces sp. NPDC091272]|uniref:hypothetical protein n=1 Tax=Streptomyces sp. NPDC091272 TaxID=3365981 RepID=UPI00381E156D